MMKIEPLEPIPTSPEAPDVPVELDLPDKPMFSVEEAASIQGVGKGTAYACVNSGEIPVLRLGRRLLIPRVGLARLLGGTPDSQRQRAGTMQHPLDRAPESPGALPGMTTQPSSARQLLVGAGAQFGREITLC